MFGIPDSSSKFMFHEAKCIFKNYQHHKGVSIKTNVTKRVNEFWRKKRKTDTVYLRNGTHLNK